MVLGAAWLAAAPQAAEARGAKNCGDGLPKYNYFDLRARQVSCDYAHRVANHHFHTGDRRFNGWKCDDDMQFEGGDTTCRRHHKGKNQKITYSFGV